MHFWVSSSWVSRWKINSQIPAIAHPSSLTGAASCIRWAASAASVPAPQLPVVEDEVKKRLDKSKEQGYRVVCSLHQDRLKWVSGVAEAPPFWEAVCWQFHTAFGQLRKWNYHLGGVHFRQGEPPGHYREKQVLNLHGSGIYSHYPFHTCFWFDSSKMVHTNSRYKTKEWSAPLCQNRNWPLERSSGLQWLAHEHEGKLLCEGGGSPIFSTQRCLWSWTL